MKSFRGKVESSGGFVTQSRRSEVDGSGFPDFGSAGFSSGFPSSCAFEGFGLTFV